MLFRRFVWGAEAEGLFTLFAITFFLLSFIITGIGILVSKRAKNLSFA